MAFSIDWPGWSRGAKTADLAVETLESYRARYRPVARHAKMVREFDAAGPLKVVEDKVGTGSTDFWGISFSPCKAEQGSTSGAELERGITLLRACWAFFDEVAARVSPEMRTGPRGGGRDRDTIIRPHDSQRERILRAQARAAGSGVRGADARGTARASKRPTLQRCASTTPVRSSGCGRGRCRTSSDTLPSTRLTMRGKWKTRT